jgi:hypothetical protein
VSDGGSMGTKGTLNSEGTKNEDLNLVASNVMQCDLRWHFHSPSDTPVLSINHRINEVGTYN